MSKYLGEQMADSYARRRPAVRIASMRFHWLVSPSDAEGASKRWLADTEAQVLTSQSSIQREQSLLQTKTATAVH